MQPWAQPLAMGIKKAETRSWKTKFRGWFLIHASGRFTSQGEELMSGKKYNKYVPNVRLFPRGSIIGVARITDCLPAEVWRSSVPPSDRRREAVLGDTGDGRFIFKVEDAVLFKKPIPYKGSLNFFDVKLTKQISDQLPANLK